jgi:outer membrane protein TolC
MGRTARRHPRLRLLRCLTVGLWAAGTPLLGIGCAGVTPVTVHSADPAPAVPAPQAAAQPPTVLPPPQPQTEGKTTVHTVDAEKPHEMPITLDAVLRLAEEHNPRIGLAREKVHDSMLEEEKACRSWLPNVYAGMGYFRHEGGIQDFQGNLIHSSTQALFAGLEVEGEIDLREATFHKIKAERDTWQQKAELSQISSDVLLDATITYIDLLVAQRAEAVARVLEEYEKKVLTRTRALSKTEAGRAGTIESVEALLSGRQQMLAKLRQQGNASSARLVYLLGLPPETVLVPVDKVLAPIDLVDVTVPVHDLVAQAMSNGPAVRELEAMLQVIQSGIDRSCGLQNLIPTVKVCAMEGLFGAGPGADMAYDNRLEIGLQFRWNLTQLAFAGQEREQAKSKQLQAMLNYDDVRGKLAAGVQESRDAIIYGRVQMGAARSEITSADKSYQENNRRYQSQVIVGSLNDTLFALRELEQAHFNYLSSISNHNKAQLRLLLLLGVRGDHDAPCAPVATPSGPPVHP